MPTGEGTYTREVIRHLIKHSPEDNLLVVIPEFDQDFISANVQQLVYPAVDNIYSRIRYGFAIGKIARRHKLDVFHCITNYAAFGSPCPVICNVMDLVTLKYPHLRPHLTQGFIYRFIFPYLLRRARFLIAISNSTRDDIKKYYGIGRRVKVVNCGVDHSKFNVASSIADNEIIMRLGLPDNYLLFVGYITPKKNIEIVLRAMARLKNKNINTSLVLVGKRGYQSDYIFNLIRQLDLEDQVTETGYVSIDELKVLYRKAGLFVFPSIYEGFGLPVVEAMACGAPVLVSSAGPLPELVGNDLYHCQPDQVDEWASSIYRMLNDTEFRQRACENSIARASVYSWDVTAKELRAIYAEVVGC